MLCEYKDFFGQPGQGLHAYRIFDLAVMDILATILVAWLIHQWWPQYSFRSILIILFILGIVLHRLFCVHTTVDKWLFN